MKLYYFTKAEFERNGRNWMRYMDKRLLVLLDTFRHQWERPVFISPHELAIGRPGWPNPNSDHFWSEPDGVVRAVDVIPTGMDSRLAAEYAIRIAEDVGFTSLGLYPHWRPSPGLHLGTRVSNWPGKPATWGATRLGPDGKPDPTAKQVYCSLEKAMEFMP